MFERLLEEYDVDEIRLRSDPGELVTGLIQQGLVRPDSDAP